MALIECPDCGTKVSSAAPACLKCGRPIASAPAKTSAPVPVIVVPEKKPTSLLTWLVAIIAVVWLLGYFQRVQNRVTSEAAPEVAAPTRTVLSIEPRILLADYKANEVRTNDMFEGHDIQLTGRVTDIGEMFKDPFLEIDSGEQYHGVHANILAEFRSKVARLSVGSSVTVVCNHSAFILGSPSLYQCAIQ